MEQVNTLQKLAKQALESQNAANPRPIAGLLRDALIAVGAQGGNPAMENSPLVRVLLSTLLNTLKYSQDAPYERGHVFYGSDIDALEVLASEAVAA